MNFRMILPTAIGLLFVVVIAVVFGRAQQKRVVVIGEEAAKARAAEERRKQRGDTAKSPMPAGQYDASRGEESLINPTRNSLDSELITLCRTFAASDAKARAAMRTSISLEEFETLLNFSQRAAVFAMRDHKVDWAKDGLTAIAMIEAERTDFRDILMSLSVLYHAARRVGANPDQLFKEASKLSEPNVKELLTGFVSRPAHEKDIRVSWGFDEVETAGGVGFIRRGYDKYHPTFDLKKMVLELGEVVAKDKYHPSVEIASNLPATWLKSPENPALDSVLQKVRAGASVFGRLRPSESASAQSQVLMVFLVEMEDASAAQELLAMSKRKRPNDYSMLGMAQGKLFCLLIGRSFQQGVPSFETPQSMQRFAAPVTEVLRKFSTANG